MRVLVAIPTYNRLFEPTIRDVMQLRPVAPGGFDVFIPAAGYGDGLRDPRDVITDKYNAARAIVLAQGYDALLTVESDMRVPADALERLAATGADVAYATYGFRRGDPPLLNAFSVMDPDAMAGYALSRVPERLRAAWGQVVEVDGVGLGCTLIRRAALAAVPFRIDRTRPHQDGTFSHCDWYFALDCVERDIRQVAHLGVLCGHISPCDLSGAVAPSVLWPDIDAEATGFVRCEAFQ
jgi:hypothetical protein